MKKTICAWLCFLVLQSPLWARTDVRFGFKGGYSMSTQYGITVPDIPYTVDTFYRHGMAAGLLIYVPVTGSFGIQQEFLYVMKGSGEDITMHDLPVNTYAEYDLNYFEIPIVLRYTYFKVKHVSFYGCSGFALSVLLNGHYRLKGTVDVEGEPLPFSKSSKMEGVDTFDYAFLYGSGAEFDLFGKSWFFEYRFTIGWNTLMMPTFDGEDPAPLRNQDYTFTLGMYF